jgi:hypothetical protein
VLLTPISSPTATPSHPLARPLPTRTRRLPNVVVIHPLVSTYATIHPAPPASSSVQHHFLLQPPISASTASSLRHRTALPPLPPGPAGPSRDMVGNNPGRAGGASFFFAPQRAKCSREHVLWPLLAELFWMGVWLCSLLLTWSVAAGGGAKRTQSGDRPVVLSIRQPYPHMEHGGAWPQGVLHGLGSN